MRRYLHSSSTAWCLLYPAAISFVCQRHCRALCGGWHDRQGSVDEWKDSYRLCSAKFRSME